MTLATPEQPVPRPVGVGLRQAHIDCYLRERPRVDLFELLTDNYFHLDAGARQNLETIRASYQVSLHGVGLSIAGTDPIAKSYVQALAELIDWIDPACVSDHLSWSSHGGVNSHDLLPIAYTPRVVRHIAARVDMVQSRLKRRIFLENPSAYLAFRGDEVDEAEFIRELCALTGCGMLLDLNNLYINARNLGTDPVKYLKTVAGLPVCYMHLAGHQVNELISVDTHGAHVPDGVWSLAQQAGAAFPTTPAMVEWDNNLPSWDMLVSEAHKARDLLAPKDTARGAGAELPTNVLLTPSLGAPRAAAAGACVTADSDAVTWRLTQDRLWRDIFASAVAADAHAHYRLHSGPPTVGLGVYSSNYRQRVENNTRNAYKHLEISAGPLDELFRRFAGVAARQGLTVDDAARHFPTFLRRVEDAPALQVPLAFLADVADFDACAKELAGRCDRPLDLALLQGIAPEAWDRLTLQFNTAFKVLRLAHDLSPYLAARSRRETVALPPSGQRAMLLRRTATGVDHEPLAPAEAQALELFGQGATFSEVFAAGAQPGATEDARVDALLTAIGRWMRLGLVEGFSLRTTLDGATAAASESEQAWRQAPHSASSAAPSPS